MSWNSSRFLIERTTDAGSGMAIRRLRQGDGTAPVVLYIHGLGESGLCFERLICDPRLAHFDHVVPDLIGYGKSTWAAEPLGLQDHATRLVRLVGSLGLERFWLAGHSMGGVIGLYLCQQLQQTGAAKALGFFNIEGNISPSDCTGSAKAASYDLDAWLAHGSDEFLPWLDASAGHEEHLDDPEVVRAYTASVLMADPRTFHRNSLELVEESAKQTLAQRLATLDLPQVYLHGVPRGTASPSLRLLADAGIATRGVSPAGHWPYLDQHDAVVDELLRFTGATADYPVPAPP